MLANLTHFTYPAHGALILGVVLGAIEGTLLVRSTAVDRRMAGCAYIKLGELVKLNFNGVIRVALALSLGLLGLHVFSQ
jgi:hypothetical protein